MSLKADDPVTSPRPSDETPSAAPPPRARGALAAPILVVLVLVIAGASVGATAAYFELTQNRGPSSAVTNTTVRDDAGRAVSVTGTPHRIVSLEPSATDILFRLGLMKQVVGVDCGPASAGGTLADYTPGQVTNWSLSKVACVTDYPTLDVSAVYALSPDLVIGGPIDTLGTLETISAQGKVPTVFLNPATLLGIAYDVEIVSKVTNRASTGDAITSAMSSSLSVDQGLLANTTAVPRVLLTYYVDSNGYWSFGAGTFGNDLLTLVGADSITANNSIQFPEVSSSYVIATGPNVVIVGTGFGLDESFYAQNAPQWSSLPAVQQGHVVPLDVTVLTEPDPTMVLSLSTLLHALHPELAGGTPY